MGWTLSAFADEAGKGVADQIAALKRAGIQHIDLRTADNHNISELPLDLAQRVRHELEAAHIRVNMLGSPIGKIDITDDLEVDLCKLSHLSELADVFGCRAVRIFSYYNKTRIDRQTWRDEALARLHRLADLARDLGLVLYLENEKEIFGDRCEPMLTIAERLHDPQTFRILFDFDNFAQCGEDVWDNWSRLKDRTDGFHLKDSTPDHMHVPVGEGVGQVRQILAEANALGWNGPLSLEPHVAHSSAVMATGASGREDQALKDLSPADSFQVAAEVAKKLLNEIGAAHE